MNPTGICPRATLTGRLTPPRSLAALGGFGLALAGMVLGSAPAASTAEYDPNLPRVEEVLDTDGSVWKVLIVPRPLYQPGLHQPPHCLVPPKHAPAGKPPVEAPVPYEKSEPKGAPAEAQKETGDEAALLLETEAIALQDTEPKTSEDKPKESAKEEEPMAKEAAEEHPFGVEIVPRFSYRSLSPSEACCTTTEGAAHINPEAYAWIYSCIPFLRSEYIANPSYRHEATMEMLFGKQRPTVVHKHPGQPRPHETQFPYENDLIRPYSYYSLGPGSGYGRGPLPYGAPGAYGVNYNFYYPMPTVYRAY